MRTIWWAWFGLAVGCSGALEPGALTITLDEAPPALTNAATVQLAGQVTRTPVAENVPIVVTVTGGGTSQTAAADANNRFAFTVTLARNADNEIQVSATDESGSTSTPLTVTVVHLASGTLTITLDAVPPALTNAATVQLAGQVTRTPAAGNVSTVVTVTRDETTQTATADASNRFAFTVTLAQNAENEIQLSATDQSGSTGPPLAVSVVHDDTGPTVVQITPANQADQVTAGTVVVTMSEPVHSVEGSGIVVSRLGSPVPGVVDMSADERTFTFTPAAPFVTGAIHSIAAGGFRDALGNQEADFGACFVTGGAGAAFADPGNDLYFGGDPANLVPPDLLEMRLARGGGELRGVLRFDAPRTFDPAAPNNLAAAIDFDTDSDGNTGFTTVKDFVFDGILAPSGAGAESAVWLLSDPSSGIEPFAIAYTGDLEGTITHTFSPDLCGVFVGFGVPEAALGLASNSFRMVGYAEAVDAAGIYADPAPETGFHAVTLAPAPGLVTFVPSSSGHGVRIGEATFLLRFGRGMPGLRRAR